MKLLLFDHDKLGVYKGENIVDVSGVVSGNTYFSPQEIMNDVIANFASYKSKLQEMVNANDGVPASSVKISAPLPYPNQLIAMAVNYMEFGARSAPAPINAFLKSPDSVIGNGDTVELPSADAAIFHHEAELGLVIGKKGFKIEAKDAYDYIFGYVNFIDVSARGLGNGSFYWGKSWDTFGPMGPCITTADEISDPQNLDIKLWVNDVLRQDFNSNDMGHNIARCIEWVSQTTVLEPGDIIVTGTNHQGLGAIQDGDKIEIEIENLNRLTVHVKDDLKREWPKGIDQATADRAAGRTTTGGFGERS